MKSFVLLLFLLLPGMVVLSQDIPKLEPGVSQGLAKWRAARYSDVRYTLSLTLEKMSPVLKGTMEIRVRVNKPPAPGRASANVVHIDGIPVPGATVQPREAIDIPVVLDWRKIRGHEEKSTVSNVSINGIPLVEGPLLSNEPGRSRRFAHDLEHLVFVDGVALGENVIKLDFTSPILTSGSAITRYVDKEDGSEYIYSLFVPSDASTAFPVFDQPDLKARFTIDITAPGDWSLIANTASSKRSRGENCFDQRTIDLLPQRRMWDASEETKPISTYVFAFAAGPFEKFTLDSLEAGLPAKPANVDGRASPPLNGAVFVRKSQAAKFKPHAAEVFRLNREAVKYFEEYFDYKFPFPKYDLVLIPEFPFGGMEHAGATFLRESSIIFPQQPTKNDHINRATLIFHEASHLWFGDTVTMRWFDDLWLKEGFATFTAYKAMEKIMPEMNAWKVFYERVKQAAYQTDSTKGTTPIYQEIPNLSAAKSAYGNIVYNKAPAFLRQSEFYLGEDKFQTAVRAFLKKHDFRNAGWEDLVKEFAVARYGDQPGESYDATNLKNWAGKWVTQKGMPVFLLQLSPGEGVCQGSACYVLSQRSVLGDASVWDERIDVFTRDGNGVMKEPTLIDFAPNQRGSDGYTPIGLVKADLHTTFVFANYRDYGYGIFLLDDKSRDYVLKNIQNEKDPFLRSMMWGALWDSVREGELDPREYVELVVKVLLSQRESTTPSAAKKAAAATPPIQEGSPIVDDESTVALLLNRVSTAMNYYIDTAGPQAPSPASAQGAERPKRPADTLQAGSLRSQVEDLLVERMRNAETLGQRITFYRAFLNVAASEQARGVLRTMLKSEPPPSVGGQSAGRENHPVTGSKNQPVPPLLRKEGSQTAADLPLKPKDRFDIVTRLITLGDPDGEKLLADLEKTETSDDAKRWAYAARAGVPTAANKIRYWNDFVANKDISESWIEAAFVPWNSIRHSDLTLPFLEKALKELPNHKRNRKIFFVNGWLGAFIGGQRSEEALAIVNKFLADNPALDRDLRLKILENVDVIERAVKIRQKFKP